MISLTQNYLTRGFWGDEAWTSLISQLPYLQMLKTTAADFHPPAYYSVVDLVYKFLPPTEMVTRSISIVFYFLTLFLVYKLASSTSGESSSATPEVTKKKRFFGAISTLVVTLNPILFTYAFEARNYTMFTFAAVGSIYFLVKLSEKLNAKLTPGVNIVAPLHTPGVLPWTIGFVLFSTLGIYTHYYMFFTLAAQGLYLVMFDRKILLRMIALYAVVALLYLPWIPFLAGQVTSVGQNYWIGTIDKRTHFEALLRILGGEHKNVFRPLLFGLSIILLTVGIIQHALRRHPSASSGPRFEKPYLLIWLWAVVPFIVATLPGLKIDDVKLPFRPIFFWRYLINASVPLAMVMVHTAEKFPKYLFVAFVGVLILLSVAIDILSFGRNPYTFRQVYQEKVIADIKSGDKLVTVLPSFAEVLYYRNRFGLTNDLVVLDEGLVQFSGKSLLDAYVASGVVRINERPTGRYFEMSPGPAITVHGQ